MFLFFLELGKRLSENGIKLSVIYGSPWAEEASRSDNDDLQNGIGIKVKSFFLFKKILFLCSFRSWFFSDLVIVEHANKNLLNYFLSVLWALNVKRLAYWGHGYNRQGDPTSFAEKYKRWSLHWADWWFAYTVGSAEYVVNQGFNPKKVSIVMNSIDTNQLRSDLLAIKDSERKEFLEKNKWNEQSRIAIYCGSLYENKRLDLLFDAAQLVYKLNPNFKLLIVGDGPLAAWVKEKVSKLSWISYVGPKFNRDKALFLSLSEIWLNPGAVGLGILDAFCSGMPILTTSDQTHGPEIECLVNNINGMILNPNAKDYASGILELLNNSELLNKLRAGATQSASENSIEIMVDNYTKGIMECLKK